MGRKKAMLSMVLGISILVLIVIIVKVIPQSIKNSQKNTKTEQSQEASEKKTKKKDKNIEQAKLLLRTTDKKAYEIAEAVGIYDPVYFSKIFKKVTGVKPKEYRSQTNGHI